MPDETQQPSREACIAALDRMIASGALGEKSRGRALLSHIVTEELEGRGDLLKAYALGIDVLGRSEDFDANSDSIVRVEIARLRQSMAAYYEGVGRDDPIVIDVPKGRYRPTFTQRAVAAEPGGAGRWARLGRLEKGIAAALAGIVALGAAYWIAASGDGPQQAALRQTDVLPVSVVQGPAEGIPETDQIAQRDLIEQVRIALSRNDAVSVLDDTPPADEMPLYTITGAVREIGGAKRFSVSMTDTQTKSLIWARSYEVDPSGEGSAPDEVVDRIARELHPQIFTAYKDALSARDPATLSAGQLFVLATWVPGAARSTLDWEKERIALSRMALEKDPDFGAAHSVLADKLSYLAEVDPPSDTPEALEEARVSLRRALELSPEDANAMFNVAIAYWHLGQMTEARLGMERVLELDPNHGLAEFIGKMIPYICVPGPDSVLQEALAFDALLAPDNPVRWVTIGWQGTLNFNRGDYDAALEAERRVAQVFQTPDTVMRYAVTLNELERPEEAAALIRAQRGNWPNISPRHHANVTMPRRCTEFPDAAPLIAAFQRMADAVEPLLEE